MKIQDCNPSSYPLGAYAPISISPSNAYIQCLSWLHLLAVGAVFASGLSVGWQLLVVLALLVSAIAVFRAWKGQSTKTIRYIDGAWYLSQATSSEILSQIKGYQFESPWVVVVTLVDSSPHRHLVVFNDACLPGDYRRLRVLLKFYW